MGAESKKNQPIKPEPVEVGEIVFRKPYDIELPDAVMSNFDHTIDEKVARKLRTKEAFAQYSGWDFCGYVWYDKKEKIYRCEVWTYHAYQETVSGTLQEIMDEVSNKYGWD